MMFKGIVLAGGTASRLFPLTRVTNKHLLPVGKIPMIYWPIARLIECGVRDIMIITSRDHMGDIVGLLGSGREIDVNFTYRVQDQAGGIAQALLLTQNFVAEDCCMVILGDNVFTSPINVLTDKFRKHGAGACIAMKEVKDPERYGVAQTDSKGIVISIEEKPNKPKSNMAVTGAYVYSPVVFDIIKTLKPSGRGELEITDVNNAYIKKNELIGVQLDKKCDWTDAGTFESLLHANKLANKLEVPKVVEKIMKRL